MRNAQRSFIALGFLAATALGGCATGPDPRYTDANGDNFGPGFGANVRNDSAFTPARPSGMVAKPREVRYRIKNSASQVVTDYVHTYDYFSVREGTRPDSIGFCFVETPARGTPAYNPRTGTHDGAVLFNGMALVATPCGFGDPWNYAQRSTSPYGPPQVDRNGNYVGLYSAPPAGPR